MPDDQWLDVVAAAERSGCSTKTIWRWVKLGVLGARKERSIGRDGRWVVKTWVRASDVDLVFRPTTHEEHVRKIRATAQPLTVEQKATLRNVFLAHLLERDAKRRRAREVERASGDLVPNPRRGLAQPDK